MLDPFTGHFGHLLFNILANLRGRVGADLDLLLDGGLDGHLLAHLLGLLLALGGVDVGVVGVRLSLPVVVAVSGNKVDWLADFNLLALSLLVAHAITDNLGLGGAGLLELEPAQLYRDRLQLLAALRPVSIVSGRASSHQAKKSKNNENLHSESPVRWQSWTPHVLCVD